MLLDRVTFRFRRECLLGIVGRAARASPLVGALTGMPPIPGTMLYDNRDLDQNYDELEAPDRPGPAGKYPADPADSPPRAANSAALRFPSDTEPAERDAASHEAKQSSA